MNNYEGSLKNLSEVIVSGQEYLKKSEYLASAYVNTVMGIKLREALNHLIDDLINKHHKVEPTESDKIYVIHYTSAKNLLSMLQFRSFDSEPSSLRLYDSVSSNDPDEGKYLVRNLVNPTNTYSWLTKNEVSHAYITSFIIPDPKKDMSDNLVFWRAYGQEGEGCSLLLHVPHSQLRKVCYGDEIEETITVLKSVLEHVDSLVNVCKHESIREIISKHLSNLIWESMEKIRYLYKSEAYRYENECRCVVVESDIEDKSSICFEYSNQNNSPTDIRHYFEIKELKLDKLLITGSSITIGPCANQPYNLGYYLGIILKELNLSGPKIRCSQIPYRKF